MFRVLTILAAVAALAVSAAPVASAGSNILKNSTATGHSAGLAPDFGIYLSLRKAPVVPVFVAGANETHTQQRVGSKAAGNVANHTEGTVRGIFAGHYRDGEFVGR